MCVCVCSIIDMLRKLVKTDPRALQSSFKCELERERESVCVCQKEREREKMIIVYNRSERKLPKMQQQGMAIRVIKSKHLNFKPKVEKEK